MEKLTNPLYHGSRGGIVGGIKPESRTRCDFGRGFYMGTNPEQSKALVANDQSPYFYNLYVDFEAIKKENILFLNDMDWAYFVLYNRGKLNAVKNTEFYDKLLHLGDNMDVITGPIADDAMNETMNRFIRSQITDKAFLESIRALDYGVQYVAKTEFACSRIKIISERELCGKELSDAERLSAFRRKEGRVAADEIQKKYRREGRYFDEILTEIEKTSKIDKEISK